MEKFLYEFIIITSQSGFRPITIGLCFGLKEIYSCCWKQKWFIWKDNLADENFAKEFAKEIESTFQLVSAKSGERINKLYNTLVDRFLSPEFNPKYEEMMKLKGNTPTIQIENKKEGKGGKKMLLKFYFAIYINYFSIWI